MEKPWKPMENLSLGWLNDFGGWKQSAISRAIWFRWATSGGFGNGASVPPDLGRHYARVFQASMQ